MRIPVLILLFLLVTTGFSQNPSSVFLYVHPDVTVVVQKHSTGADMVEITMGDPNYPLELLQAQANTMCSLIGSPARGLAVTKDEVGATSEPDLTFVKATFATDGLIEPDGALKVEPIIKALVGAPAPYTIHGISITFEDMAPNPHTVREYSIPNVLDAAARYTANGVLKGIEYRVQLNSQDPDKITFPDRYQPAPPEPPARIVPEGPHYGLFVGILITGIALGALVYFVMLRSGSKGRS